MIPTSRVEQIGGLAALGLILVGCLFVLQPFVSALLWAAIICFATWPLHERLLRATRGRRVLSAALMTALIVVCMVLPFAIVGVSFADDLRDLAHQAALLRTDGLPPPPAWVDRLPVVGNSVHTAWLDADTRLRHTPGLLPAGIQDLTGWLLRRGVGLGQGLFQLSMSVLIAFFFYRSGETVVVRVRAAVQRIAGDRTQRLMQVVGASIKAVVYGVLGTAVAQGVVAAIGFGIAGVPLPFLLGLLTFFLSLAPMGPPLVWISATIWLAAHDHLGWTIFMALWGLCCISGIDNLVRPMLISRSTDLPFVLTFLGVLGGLIAFGFIGVFLGPTLLAVGYALAIDFAREREAGVVTVIGEQ